MFVLVELIMRQSLVMKLQMLLRPLGVILCMISMLIITVNISTMTNSSFDSFLILDTAVKEIGGWGDYVILWSVEYLTKQRSKIIDQNMGVVKSQMKLLDRIVD